MSRGDRVAAQRERLLSATALAFVADDLSVTRIVALAGVGRATFYEFFDDVEHALFGVRERVLRQTALELAEAPESASMRDALESISGLWLAAVRRDPCAAMVALNSRLPELSPLAELFGRALVARARQSAVASTDARAAHASSSAAEPENRGALIATRASPDSERTHDSGRVEHVRGDGSSWMFTGSAFWFALVAAQAAAARVARDEVSRAPEALPSSASAGGAPVNDGELLAERGPSVDGLEQHGHPESPSLGPTQNAPAAPDGDPRDWPRSLAAALAALLGTSLAQPAQTRIVSENRELGTGEKL